LVGFACIAIAELPGAVQVRTRLLAN
jgi:hypothetical protein